MNSSRERVESLSSWRHSFFEPIIVFYLQDQSGCVLVAGQETLSAEDTSLWVDVALEDIDCYDMGTLLVWVFHPVGSSDLSPGVVECMGCLEELHGG